MLGCGIRGGPILAELGLPSAGPVGWPTSLAAVPKLAEGDRLDLTPAGALPKPADGFEHSADTQPSACFGAGKRDARPKDEALDVLLLELR